MTLADEKLRIGGGGSHLKRGAEALRSLHQRVGDEYMICSISRSALSVSLPPLLLR